MSRWTPPGPAILFAPADRPERFAKAIARADAVIFDLEDGSRPANRAAARAALADAHLDPARSIIRINPPGTSDYAADIAAVAQAGVHQVMLAKAQDPAELTQLAADLRAAGCANPQLIALLETPRGVLAAAGIAAVPEVVALFWGAEDLTAGLGGTASRYSAAEAELNPAHPAGTYRVLPAMARAQIQLAAAAWGKAALDSVYTDIADHDGLRAEALDAVALGFAATVCIHPGQVQVIREAYAPTPEQAQWARGLLAAAKDNQGAFAYQGQMVDAPLFAQAVAIVSRITPNQSEE